jgi:hypothetical protein
MYFNSLFKLKRQPHRYQKSDCRHITDTETSDTNRRLTQQATQIEYTHHTDSSYPVSFLFLMVQRLWWAWASSVRFLDHTQIHTPHSVASSIQHCMMDTWGCKLILRICNTFCFPTAIMVTRSRLSVPLCVQLPVLLIIIVIILKRMKCTRHVAPVNEMTNTHNILIESLQGKGWLGDRHIHGSIWYLLDYASLMQIM